MEVTSEGLIFVDRDANQQLIKADHIVPTRPLRSNPELFNILKDKAPEVYSIGDCREPRKIVNAIADAFDITRQL